MRWGLLSGIGLGVLAGLIYSQQRNRNTALGQNMRRKNLIQPSAAARHGFREGVSGAAELSSAARRDFLTIINEWPHERLIAIDGIGPVLATKIIAHRPYKTTQELVNSKLLPPSAIEALRLAS